MAVMITAEAAEVMIMGAVAEVATTVVVEVRVAMTEADIPVTIADAGGAGETMLEEARNVAEAMKGVPAQTATAAAVGRMMAGEPRCRRKSEQGSSIKHVHAPAGRMIAWK